MTILRSDNFNRADTTNNIGTPSDGGSDWVQYSYDWGIYTNKAYANNIDPFGSPFGAVAALETGSNIAEASVVVANFQLAHDPGLVVRLSSAGNYIVWRIEALATTRIYKVSGDLATELAAFATARTNGDTYSLRVDGANLISAYRNGILQGSVTNSFNSTATKHGLFTDHTGNRFDNFSIDDDVVVGRVTSLVSIRLPNFIGSPSGATSLGDCNLYWCSKDSSGSPSKLLYCPSYLDVSDELNVTGRSDTQAVADLQIDQAYRSGIDCFAFNFASCSRDFLSAGIGYNGAYHEFADNFNAELTLHRSSTKKALVKFCLTLNAWYPLLPVLADDSSFNTYVTPYLVAAFQDPTYMTVLGGRPLLLVFNPTWAWTAQNQSGVFSDNAACATAITQLRAACVSGGVGNPYIVAILAGGDLSSVISACGFDAGGAYSSPSDAASAGQTAASWITSVEASWPTQTGFYGTAFIPTCVTGADHNRIVELRSNGFRARDRLGNLTAYSDSTYGYQGANLTAPNYSLPQTTTQWAAHVVAGKAYEAVHCAAGVLLLSAGIEQDVAPPLIPTWGDKGMYYQMMAQAIGRQRENHEALRARGIQLLSR